MNQDLSVIVCTHNRHDSLRRLLDSMGACQIPPGLAWELLVVDNNSKDNTKTVCESFQGKLPLRYLFEPRQGKSFALNRSLKEAEAPLLLLTDDDVSVTPDWIASMYAAAQRHPNVSFFGGRVISKYEKPPPQWFLENESWLNTNPRIDWGETEREVKDPREIYFLGANFAVRKAVFTQGLSYREDMGPSGVQFGKHSRHGGEDYEIQLRLVASGCKGLYVPSRVFHNDPPHRMTEKYVRWWYLQHGREKIHIGSAVPSENLWFGAPRYLWRKLISNGLKYVLCRRTCASQTWLKAEVACAATWGEICELRRLKRTDHLRHG